MHRPEKILKNTGFIGSGLIVDGVLLFLIFAAIARYLDVDGLGRFVFLLNVNNIFQIFASGGLVNISIREMARDKTRANWILSRVLSLSWIVLLVLFLLVYGLIQQFSVARETQLAACLLNGTSLIMVHGALHGAILRAHEYMGRVALTAFAHKLALGLGVSIAIWQDGGLVGVAWAYIMAAGINWCLFFVGIRRAGFRPYWCVDAGYWRFLLRESIPLGLGLTVRRMSLHVDTLLLWALANAHEVGLFNCAYRIIQMLELAVLALMGVLFPAFSRLAVASSREDFERLLQSSVRLFLILAVAAASMLAMLSRHFIQIAYGERYLDAGPMLSILAMVLLFVMPGGLFFYVFSALHRQRVFLYGVASALLLNLILDFFLVPRYGALGAAWSTLISENVLFLLFVRLLSMTGLSIRIGKPLLACLLIACVFLPVLYWGQQQGNILTVMLAAGLFLAGYIAAVIDCAILPKTEWRFFRQCLKKRRSA